MTVSSCRVQAKHVDRMNVHDHWETYDLENERRESKKPLYLSNQFIHACTSFVARDETHNWSDVYIYPTTTITSASGAFPWLRFGVCFLSPQRIILIPLQWFTGKRKVTMKCPRSNWPNKIGRGTPVCAFSLAGVSHRPGVAHG